MILALQKYVIMRIIGKRGFMSKKKPAQSIIEYGLIMVMVAVISVTVLNKFGVTMNRVGNRSTAAVSTGDSIDDYCNALPEPQKTECTTNIH